MAQIKSKGKYATAPATLSIFGNEVGIRKIMRRGYPNYIPLIVVDEGPPRKYIQVAENPDKLRKYICALEKGGMHFDKTLSLVKEGTLTFSNELRDIA